MYTSEAISGDVPVCGVRKFGNKKIYLYDVEETQKKLNLERFL